MSFNVFASYLMPDDSPAVGYVDFIPNGRVPDGSNILVPQSYRVYLDPSGSIDVNLERCIPFGYTVIETFLDGPRIPLQLPDGAGPFDLRDLSPGPQPNTAVAYLPLTGGTLIGPVILAADATAPLGATTLEQVRTSTGGSNDKYLDHGVILSGPLTIDLSVANTHRIILGVSGIDLVFSAVTAGKSQSFTLRVTQPSVGNNTIGSYPAGVDFGNAGLPILSESPNLTDVLVFTSVDGGAHWTGHVAGLGFAVG